MKRYQYAIATAIMAILFSTTTNCALATTNENQDVLYQVSTIDALLLSVYDGISTFGDLKAHGDFGIGTFDALEGEMVALNGEYYQVKADGIAYPVPDNMTTPFATVTFFEPDERVFIEQAGNYSQFEDILDKNLPSENVFYAVRIDGTFPYMKTRSIPKQEKPYPLLRDAAENQNVFEFQDVKGTVVGFWTPTFAKGINVAGYHLHFISEDRTTGGHILDFQLEDGNVELDVTPKFFMALPTEGDFYNVDLTQDLQADLEKVEK